jgi:hypothetical protein
VTRRYWLILLVVFGLLASGPSGSAWAHPGHGPSAARDEDPAPRSLDLPFASHHPAPPVRGLAVAALALLTTVLVRRRTLAVALSFVLALAAGEGVFHAALHLGHLPHGDGLAIGSSMAAPAALDAETDTRAAYPPILLGATPERDDGSIVGVARASDRGRAPPLSPA